MPAPPQSPAPASSRLTHATIWRGRSTVVMSAETMASASTPARDPAVESQMDAGDGSPNPESRRQADRNQSDANARTHQVSLNRQR
jgi:hypothetical protein